MENRIAIPTALAARKWPSSWTRMTTPGTLTAARHGHAAPPERARVRIARQRSVEVVGRPLT
jgi:hypothetical protein